MMKWQPIETAPRDKEIIVYGACNFPKSQCCGKFCHIMRIAEVFDANDPEVKKLNITHWMPLPDPPEATP